MQLDFLHHTLVRWSDADPKYVPLLVEGGVTAVLTNKTEAFGKACADAGIQVVAETDVSSVSIDDGAKAKAGNPVIFKAGIWPGVQRPDPQTAGATRSLWLDQNCWLVRYLQAQYPKIQPVLGYLPDTDAGISAHQLIAFDALELALVEAWVCGGNYVMALHQSFREPLLKGDAKALAAWRKLGVTAKWLRTNEALFRQPVLPIVTVLVNGETSKEVASLSYRQNVSPAVMRADQPPAPDPARCKVLVAVGLETPPEGEAKRKILANAEAGCALIVDGKSEQAWWRVPGLKPAKGTVDRNCYSLGKGQVVAYKEDVEDPGMVALDVLDILTQKQRAARLWNCNAGIVMATAAPGRNSSAMQVINYSRPTEIPVLARIQGNFKRAVLMRPEAAPVDLKVAPRGTGTEVSIPQLQRVATVIFS